MGPASRVVGKIVGVNASKVRGTGLARLREPFKCW